MVFISFCVIYFTNTGSGDFLYFWLQLALSPVCIILWHTVLPFVSDHLFFCCVIFKRFFVSGWYFSFLIYQDTNVCCVRVLCSGIEWCLRISSPGCSVDLIPRRKDSEQNKNYVIVPCQNTQPKTELHMQDQSCRILLTCETEEVILASIDYNQIKE